VARGVSPPTVAICAVLFVGERLSVLQVAGLAGLTGGLLAVATGRGRASHRGLTFAVITGLAIAGYTVLDGIGVRRSGTALGYTGWLFVAEGLILPVIWLAARGRRSPEQPWAAAVWLRCVAAGVLSVIAYGLVLWAQTRGALAIVAALRETSVVFGAVLGAVVFRDGMPTRRVMASVLIAAGAVTLAAG
jgi:drug/metabolite transporter (DMT)-like permease